MSYMNGHLEVVASLAGRVIDVRLVEQRAEADLALALHQMHETGVTIEDLSAAASIPTERVRQLISQHERTGKDSLASLAGRG